jgi:hypothetical protein
MIWGGVWEGVEWKIGGQMGRDRRRRGMESGEGSRGIRERGQHGERKWERGEGRKEGKEKNWEGNRPFQLEILATPMGHTSIHFCIAR